MNRKPSWSVTIAVLGITAMMTLISIMLELSNPRRTCATKEACIAEMLP